MRKESWLLKLCHHAFYHIIARMTLLKLPQDAGDFCLVSREVADVMKDAREQHRYLRGLRTWAGFRQVPLLVERDARSAGDYKYGWRQLFGLAFDGILSFSTIRIRMATWLGLAIVILTLILSFFGVVEWSLNFSSEGITALATSLAFFGGVQLVFFGLIGEYVGRIYGEVKNRPLYVLRKNQGLDLSDKVASDVIRPGTHATVTTHLRA
jgi:glycosyltransferase involved in cell wall biosynthesis